MFNFFKKAEKKVNNKPEPIEPEPTEPDAIAAPRKSKSDFIPMDAILPNQTIPGKFNATSATWKYLENYLNDRIDRLQHKNELVTLSYDRTQLVRGQIKEIKLLFNHTNYLAGVNSSPSKSALDQSSTARGTTYE